MRFLVLTKRIRLATNAILTKGAILSTLSRNWELEKFKAGKRLISGKNRMRLEAKQVKNEERINPVSIIEIAFLM